MQRPSLVDGHRGVEKRAIPFDVADVFMTELGGHGAMGGRRHKVVVDLPMLGDRKPAEDDQVVLVADAALRAALCRHLVKLLVGGLREKFLHRLQPPTTPLRPPLAVHFLQAQDVSPKPPQLRSEQSETLGEGDAVVGRHSEVLHIERGDAERQVIWGLGHDRPAVCSDLGARQARRKATDSGASHSAGPRTRPISRPSSSYITVVGRPERPTARPTLLFSSMITERLVIPLLA